MIRRHYLTDIADVKRTEKNRVYPKGTIYIQVSACKRNAEGMWMITDHDTPLDDKYAVVLIRGGGLILAMRSTRSICFMHLNPSRKAGGRCMSARTST